MGPKKRPRFNVGDGAANAPLNNVLKDYFDKPTTLFKDETAQRTDMDNHSLLLNNALVDSEPQ